MPKIALSYGSAHFGKSLFWYASEVLFAFFLTEVCRIAPWPMAVILSVSIAVNAIADTLVGSILSGRMRSLDGAVRLQTWGAAVSGLCLVAFLASGLTPAMVRLPYAVATLMLFRLAYALYDVPQNVVLALAGRATEERSTLSALRIFGSGSASLLMSGLFVPLLAGKPTSIQALDTAGLAAAMTVCAVLTSVILRAKGRGPIASEASPPAAAGIARINLSAVALLAANLVFSSGTAFFTRLEPYFAAYGARSRLAGAGVLIVIALGGLLAQPIFALLARHLTTWRLLAVSTLIQMFGCGALYLTLMHSSRSAPIIISGLVYGFGAGGAMMLSWVALTNLITSAGLSAPRLFGLFTFASKVGLAFSNFMLGYLLARGDYHGQWSGNMPLISVMTLSPMFGALAYLVFAVAYRPAHRRV